MSKSVVRSQSGDARWVHTMVVTLVVALVVVTVPTSAQASTTSTQLSEDPSIPTAGRFQTGDYDAGTGRVFIVADSSEAKIHEVINDVVTPLYSFGTADGWFYEAAFASEGGHLYWATNNSTAQRIWTLDPNNTAAGKQSLLTPGCGYIYAIAVSGTDFYFACDTDKSIRHGVLVPGASISNVTTVLSPTAATVVDLAYRSSDGAIFYLAGRTVFRLLGGVVTTVVVGTSSTPGVIRGIDVGADGFLFLTLDNGTSAGDVVQVVTDETAGTVSTVFALPGYNGAYAYPSDFIVTNGTAASGTNDIGYLITVSSPYANAFKLTGTVDVTTAPQAPSNLAATAGDGQLSVSFTLGSDGGSAVTDIEYQLNNGLWVSASTTTSPVAISGLANGQSYDVKLRALNAVGPGTESLTVTATPRTAPQAPSNLVAIAGDGQLSVSFTLGSDGGSAVTDIEYQLDNGLWVSASTTTSPVAISGLTNGQSYDVKLRALNAVGPGTESSAVTATPTKPAAPSAPAPSPTTCDAVQGSARPCASFADTGDLDLETQRDLGSLQTIGIFLGRPDGSFGFEEPLQRYEAVWVLTRTHRLIFDGVLPDPAEAFVDLEAGASAEAAAQLHALGILYGTGAGRYQPNVAMQAGHWALALERLAILHNVQLPNGDTALDRLIAAGWLPAGSVTADTITRLDVALSIARLSEAS